VVAGNTTLEQGLANLRRGLAAMDLYGDGRSADLSRTLLAVGAEAPLEREPFFATEVHGPDGLGGAGHHTDTTGLPLYPEADFPLDPRPASDVILDCAEAYPGEVTLAAIGPLTNLALALRKDPGRFRKLREIVAMGGAFLHHGNTGPRSEFNIHVDPEAAREVLESGVPLTMVPLDCSEQARLMWTDIEGPGRVRRFVRDVTGFIMDFHVATEGFHGSFHHDPLAVGVALDPSFASGVHTRVAVETRGEHTAGETVAGLRPNRPLMPGPANARVMLRPDAARFERFFLDRVLPAGA